MRRILVIGNSGGGKTTLARRLGETLGLPVVHLDVLYWNPGWTAGDPADFRRAVAAAAAGEAWICEGNFADSFDLRMPRADTIVWIDPPPLLCVARAVWRVLTYGDGRDRPDMPKGCAEKLDLALYRDILDFRRTYHPLIERALALHGAHARLVRLRSDREIARFLAQA